MKRGNIIILWVLPIPVILVSLLVGPSESISPAAVIDALLNDEGNKLLLKSIIMDVRLPRILLTFLVGGSLAVSGCSMQAIFRNPLTDSYILGLSSGAAFGAALALAVHDYAGSAFRFCFRFTRCWIKLLHGNEKQKCNNSITYTGRDNSYRDIYSIINNCTVPQRSVQAAIDYTLDYGKSA